jgi:hypothetical protein
MWRRLGEAVLEDAVPEMHFLFLGMVFHLADGVEDHGFAGCEVSGPCGKAGGGGGFTFEEGDPGGVHFSGEGGSGGGIGEVFAELVPDEAQVFGVIGLGLHAACGGGDVEAVHPNGAAAGTTVHDVGFGDAEGGDPILLGGDGADAELLGGHVGVDLLVVGEDLVETSEGDVA